MTNFEYLAVDTLEQAEALAAPRFFEMVREHDRSYVLSSTRYSTDAFLRRKLARAFADAGLSQTIYRSFEEGASALPAHAARRRPGSNLDD